jgi:hypothetical protein
MREDFKVRTLAVPVPALSMIRMAPVLVRVQRHRVHQRVSTPAAVNLNAKLWPKLYSHPVFVRFQHRKKCQLLLKSMIQAMPFAVCIFSARY